ncbi:MAG: tyrosine-type recombinase/integrase, partial [Tepidisphaeraceae bacterium]
MASIGNDAGGRKRILFVAGDGTRKTIRLGKLSQRQAEAFKVRVEALIGQAITGAVDDETSRWVAERDDETHERLAAVGLVKPRENVGAAKLGAFIDQYIAGRNDIKPNTLIGLGQARRNLIEFFKADRTLASITEGDADEYRLHLLGKGLAINTARRLLGRAKQLFRFACRKHLIRDNPFAGIESNVRSNPARQFFITRADAAKVTAACPDAEWKLIFALARYGGLRTPSETLTLKWADVDFDKGRIRVPSPKTEHIEGRASRMIPMFPELRAPMLEVFTAAEPGTEYVITRYRRQNQNLRTHFERIIKWAGLTPWPKLFHNLRASRQTELAETYPAHVVCAWLGNTQAVALAHYLQITDEHFASAAAPVETPLATPVDMVKKSGTESGTVGVTLGPHPQRSASAKSENSPGN